MSRGNVIPTFTDENEWHPSQKEPGQEEPQSKPPMETHPRNKDQPLHQGFFDDEHGHIIDL